MMINKKKKKRKFIRRTYLHVECSTITRMQMAIEHVDTETLGIKHKKKAIK